MEVIMPILLISTVWGASIGSKNGLRFWLYGSLDGFGAALWAALGFWISFGGGLFTLVGLAIFLYASTALYKVTKNQLYRSSSFEVWMLFMGKLSFSIMTAGLLFLIAILFGAGGSKK